MAMHSLNEGWWLRAAAGLDAGGEALSRPGASTRGWIGATLPATVLGAIVDTGAVGDPMTGARLREIPGQGPAGENFSNHPMPDDSPFAGPWWFRTEFRAPDDALPFVRLQLDGVNYRANVWLNGVRLAGADDIVGTYRVFELDVVPHLRRDELNALAIEVLPPRPCDLALSWVDWNPAPADKNMGLWRDVWLRSSGPVALRDPHVVTRLEPDGSAHLVAGGDLVNADVEPRAATICAVVAGARVQTQVELAPGERRRFDLPAVRLREPRLWWPRALGEPALYELDVEVRVGDIPSDRCAIPFGVREVTSELTADGYAQFRINGRPVLIRGAGWACDLFLRRDPAREYAQLDYVEAMHLDTIRFEGMLERTELLEECDRRGILVIAGWCCCDCWERWDEWSAEAGHVAVESLRSQLRRVRRHPSMISWWYGSDFPPPAHVEGRYQQVVREEHWPNPTHSSAANKPAELTGPSGMKMEGPYDWVPPNYWYEDRVRGGAFGFATEICPGPAVPPLESLRRMLTDEHLWPMDDVWRLHAGCKEFHNIDAFTEALLGRFGALGSVEELAELSQLMTYEAQRAMFEAYARNRGRATGVIQWMLNNAWPSLIWHLFDYYLRPGGGFFGTRKACQPLHVLYGYDDRGVVVVNDTGQPHEGLRVTARVWNLAGGLCFEREVTVGVADGGNVCAAVLPPLPDDSPVCFVDLRMALPNGREVDRNFYWIPRCLDRLDHANHNWMRTPVLEHADLRALRRLPIAGLDAVAVAQDERVCVRLRNAGSRLAFFVQLRLADAGGDDLLPVVWSDNYVSLLPGDELALDATIPPGAEPASIAISALNVAPFTVALPQRWPRSLELSRSQARRMPLDRRTSWRSNA